MGANTAIFSVVDAILLRPLPYSDPARLLCLWRGEANGYPWYTFSHPRFRYLQDHARDVAELAAYDDETVTLTGQGEPVGVEGGRVSANFFSLLGVQPALGRTFREGEDRHGAVPVVLLSDRLWRRRYSADSKVLGRPVRIDGEMFTIIGVLPAAFQFQGETVDVWRSRIVDTRTFAPDSVQLGASYLSVVARLRPGVTLAQARGKFDLLGAQYAHINPGNSDLLGSVHVDSLQSKLFAPLHMVILVLWGAVLCLLIIACANLANLVLTRATARYRDVSIRVALGASRWRIARQLVTEHVLLSLIGALWSLPLAMAGIHFLEPALRQSSHALPAVRVNAVVLLFMLAVAGATGILFGLTPLFVFSGNNLRTGLQTDGRSGTSSGWATQLRSVIVVAQFALCLVLLAAAGLLAESFVRMRALPTGVRTEHILTTQLDLMPDRYQSWPARVNFYDDLLRRVTGLAGVSGAAIASRVDLVGSGLGYVVQVEGAADLGPKNPAASGRSVSPDYFNVLGIPVLRGRAFTAHDTAQSQRVMIVNEAFARKFFPGRDAVGRHVTYSTDRITCEIVGVARDVRASLSEPGAEQEIYLPLAQRPWLVAKLLVQTFDAAQSSAAIRRSLQAVDPAQAAAESNPLDQIVAARLGRPRTIMSVVGLFAVSALLLAAIGIYGVMAYNITQRTREIGIRIALGAAAPDVRALVLGQTVKLLLAGLLLGLPLAAALNPIYQSLLFGVTPADPAAFLTAIALLLMVAFSASAIPAVRATRVDPVVVLRAE